MQLSIMVFTLIIAVQHRITQCLRKWSKLLHKTCISGSRIDNNNISCTNTCIRCP